MRDPFAWSFPIGRLFGITVRVHILFPIIALGLFLRITKDHPNLWPDVLAIQGLFFLCVLLHEFGHCFAGRWVGGEANEVLMWPLGGLASVDVPHTPRANLIMVLGGPGVNVVLFLAAALTLAFAFPTSLRPPFNPFWDPFYAPAQAWDGQVVESSAVATFLLRMFWVNWTLFWFNMLIVAFPLDAGRVLQCVLWPYVGYRQATRYAVMSGFGFMFLLLMISLWVNDTMIFFIGIFIYVNCLNMYNQLESGAEDSLFGYDFSQGYTSLERDQPAPVLPRKKQPNFIRRWLERRATRKMLLEQQRTEEDEYRMDQLLQKIAESGKGSLTDEEHRFLKRVSDRYRNRH